MYWYIFCNIQVAALPVNVQYNVLGNAVCFNIGDIVIVTRHTGESAWGWCVSGGLLVWWRNKYEIKKWKFIDVIKMIGNSVTKFYPNYFLQYQHVVWTAITAVHNETGVWSECNICVCSVCTGNRCVFILFVMCENTDITWFDVLPINSHIVVSIYCTVLVEKSQGMQQLMYNCALWQTSVALEVQFLALWVIENLWLTVARQERNFVTTRSLIVACISAEATTSSQTWWSQ
jgi:hypothetical protein